ncbi:MAG: cytochrome b/b6 domain-containing protein [Dehalococcoidia bacterium]|nr:cytochrome b/b6 domain-containing protein [Dehalococcoidia bacterium]
MMADLQTQLSRHPIAFRILHEIMMISIFLLIVTGFYIHRPFVEGGGFLMTTARGVHYFFAAILMVTAVTRILCMFIGKNRDWRSFLPTWSDFKLLPGFLLYYALIAKEPKLKKKYNPLQMISYSFVFVMVLFQIVSGFAIQYPNGWLQWFNTGLFNNVVQVRMAHYIVNWAFVLFIMIHVYLTIRESFHEVKEMHLLAKSEEGHPGGKEPIHS